MSIAVQCEGRANFPYTTLQMGCSAVKFVGMSLDDLPADQVIYHTFDALRRVVISAAEVTEIRDFDARLFSVLQAVAGSEVTLFPGLADVKAAIHDELDLTESETASIGETLRQGMQLDREIAQRLLTFLRNSSPSP